MKKNTNILVVIMALIGTICTGIILFLLWKNHKKNNDLLDDYFDEDDFDFDFADEMEEVEEEKVEEEVAEAAAEEEVPEDEQVAPKARRGYFPLKFHVGETA